jgi:HK97 family phage major capsid protein
MQFQTLDPSSHARASSIARDLATFYAEAAGMHESGPRFSLARMIRAMSSEDFRAGSSYEAEVCQAAALAAGQGASDLNPQSAFVPWAALGRDLIVGTPAAGGRLVGAQVARAVDVLRPFSVVSRMGIQTRENLRQDLLVPNLSTPVTGQWLADESTAIAASDPVTGLTTAKPKTGGALIRASFNFVRDAEQSESFVRAMCLATVGGMLDQAVIAGSGAAGQPVGILAQAGVTSQTGAATLANMLGAVQVVSEADADDEQIRVLSTPGVRTLLQQREAVATSGSMLWSKGTVADKPAFVSTQCPAATMIFGDWSQVLVSFWGPGVRIEVDPYTSFKTGAIQVRVLMFADVSVLKPAAFRKHTSLT